MTATPNDTAPLPGPRLPEPPTSRTLRSFGPDAPSSADPVALRGPRPAGKSDNQPEGENAVERKQGPDMTPASFFDLRHVLEQRSREWTNLVRQLEQHRQQLTSLEAEQNAAYEQLERVVPVVQGTYRSLKASIEARKSGDPAAEIDELAAVNSRALEELEKLAGALSTQAIWFRSAWEQYSKSVESAQRLRTQFDNLPHA